MIRGLGAARYGVWMLLVELGAYFLYLDFGIRSALVYFTAFFLAYDERDEVDKIVATGVWTLAALGALGAAAGSLLADLFPLAFDIAQLDGAEVRRALIVMACSAGVSLPVEGINSVLTGNKHAGVGYGINGLSRTASFIAMIFVVIRGGGLVPLAYIQLAYRTTTLVIYIFAIRSTTPRLRLSPFLWRPDSLRSLAGVGLPSLFINLGQLAGGRSDLIIAGMFAGVGRLAFYGVPRALIEYASLCLRTISLPFSAHFTQLHATRDDDATVNLYLKGSRLTSMAAFLLSAYMAAFGKPFLLLWQGQGFLTAAPQNRADIVLLILVPAFLPSFLHSISLQVLSATRQLRFLAWILNIEAIVKVLVSLVFVQRWGLAGLAAANILPILLFEGLAVPAYLFRRLHIPAQRYRNEAILPALGSGLMVYAISFSLVAVHPPASWIVFVAEAAVALLAGAGLAVWQLLPLAPVARMPASAWLQRAFTRSL